MELSREDVYTPLSSDEAGRRMDPYYSHNHYAEGCRHQMTEEGFHLILILHGKAVLEERLNISHIIPEGTCNLIYLNTKETTWLSIYPETEVMRFSYPGAFVYQNLGNKSWPDLSGASGTSDTRPCVLFSEAMAFSPDFLRIIRDLLHCPLEGYYLDLFTRAKATEMLAFLFHYYDQPSRQKGSGLSMLSEEIRERMQRVRGLLHERLDDPPSIPDLAQMVGTNENYLKIHFKQMFGTTVYGYLHQLRMDKAKTMLLHERRTIADIARKLGYKHASHFSTVFKKHFGVSPREINR